MAEELHPRLSGLRANPDPPAPRRRLQIRILRRVFSSEATTYHVATCAGFVILGVLGGVLGFLHWGIHGALGGTNVGMLLGVLLVPCTGPLLGAFSGAVIGGLAWVFDGPWRGA